MDSRTIPMDFNTVNQQTRHPQRVAIAAVERPEGGYNLITIEWFMRTSIQPPMLAISVGHTRFSHVCLMANRRFNLWLPSRGQADLARLCGSVSGRTADKLAGVDWFRGRHAQLPVLQGAAAVYECEVVTQVRSGDHTIFVGEVKHSWRTPDTQPLCVADL